MLNRLYIVIGVIAILILAAAFIVPGLVPWGSYRGRMETLASKALGAEVRINGDIHFALLPAPHLELTDVAVGPPDKPVMSVKSADADFSLIDFLRDKYSMTRLVLDHPVLKLAIARDGTVETGLKPSLADRDASISASDARIAVGRVDLVDAVSGRIYTLEGIDGDLTFGALNGPVGFSGGGSLAGQHYNFHVTATAFDPAGNTQVSLFAQPDGNAFSLTVTGALATAGTPHFTGNLSYRQTPPADRNANGLIGDLTFTGKLDATPAKAALAAFTLIPDENRAVTRLTGSLTLDLGASPSFAANVSSNDLALPPRDATTEKGPQPYELVRLLGELPVVPMPSIPGKLVANVAQLDLRSFSLNHVKLAASTDAKLWSIDALTGRLAGNTSLKLAGELSAPDGRPNFSGTIALSTDRLDQLATLWRKPAPGNPLFDMPGSFQCKVSLLGQTMALTDGQLTLDGTAHLITALINFGAERRIDLSGQFKALDADDSAALLALIPDLALDPSAGVTFPQGAVSLTADAATIFGIAGKGLAVEGKWGNGEVELSKFSAADFGGAGLDLSLALSGSMTAPRLAGDGTIKLAAAGAPVLARVFDLLGTPTPVRALLSRSLPLDLKAHLDGPKDDGGQGLSLSGKAGVADMTVVARFEGGLPRALVAPVSASLDLESADPGGLTAQLGLGDVSLLPDSGPVKLTVNVDGPPTGPMQASIAIAGGGDTIAFDGTVTPGDLTAISGSGKLSAALSDTSVLAADAGLAGIYTPPLKGNADLSFTTGRSLALDNIVATSGRTGFTGKLALNGDAHGAAASGALRLDSLDLGSLLVAAGGPTITMKSAGKLWPDGPIAIGDMPRATTGHIAVKTPIVTLGDQKLVTDAGFDLDWDATNIGVRRFAGKLGGGTLSFGVGVCCAGPLADKQVSGEASVKGVAASALLPAATASALAANVDASLQFAGTGDSVDAVLDSLSGDGSFALSGLKVQSFDPDVFASIAATGDLVDLDPETLGDKVASGLGQGPFSAPNVAGGFTIAGGLVRAPNVAAQTPAAKLFGGATLKLSDLSLGGAFSLTPVGTLDKAGVVSETTSKVTANLSGTLLAPARTLDIASMVDAIKVKALEVEVARLEKLKAADDARAKAADIARKEAIEDQQAQELAAQQAAQKAAAQAAAQKAAAAKKAAEDAAAAAAKAASEAARQSAGSQTTTPSPFDLQMPQAPFF